MAKKKVEGTIEVTKAKKTGTSILLCTCVNEYQDKVYGNGKRVHNNTFGGKARCTVCNSLKG